MADTTAYRPYKPVFIYGLWCPIAKKFRYIGKTVNPDDRLTTHLSFATGGAKHPAARWMRRLAKAGLRPRLRLLSRVPIGEDWRDAERDMIAAARAKGWPLTNATVGGDGVEFISEEHAAAAKAARAAGFTPDVCARKAESMRARWATPGYRERLSEALSRSSSTEEGRARLSRSARMKTEDGKRRHREAMTAQAAARRKEATIGSGQMVLDFHDRPSREE